MDEQPVRKAVDARDVVGVAGVALITGGAWMVYPPAALIVCGVLLLGGAIMAARR